MTAENSNTLDGKPMMPAEEWAARHVREACEKYPAGAKFICQAGIEGVGSQPTVNFRYVLSIEYVDEPPEVQAARTQVPAEPAR